MALASLQVELTEVLGKTRLPLRKLLRMGRGAVIALDASEVDAVDILANGLLIARGRVTVERGAVEVIELVRKVEVTRVPGSHDRGAVECRGRARRRRGVSGAARLVSRKPIC